MTWKSIYVKWKEEYDGFGRRAQKNTVSLVQAEFAEELKWVARRNPVKKCTTGDGEKGIAIVACSDQN